MKIIVVLVFTLLASIFSANKKAKPEIKGLKVKEWMYVINDSFRFVKWIPYEVDLYNQGDIFLYRLIYGFDSVDLNINKILKSETREHYFIFEKDSLYGYDYDEHENPKRRILRKDSVIEHEWALQINLDYLLTDMKAKLISSVQNKDSGTIHELYSYIGNDTSSHGRFYLSFSTKMGDIDYSLSKKIDSTRGMKLYNAWITQDPRYFKKFDKTLNELEYGYEIQKITVITPEIQKYFENYRN